MSGHIGRSAARALLACGAMAIAPCALAGDPVPPAMTEAAVAPPSQWTSIPERAVSNIGTPVDVARLDHLRGGEDQHTSFIVVDGSVDHNSADRIISGHNTIGSDAFDNASGINTVIQNTGTNVLIQNAMVVHVSFVEPAP